VQNAGNGGKIAIVGAIITAIAGIITAIVSISGPLIDKRMAIQATQTREAVLASNTKVSAPTVSAPTVNGTPSGAAIMNGAATSGAAAPMRDTPAPEIPPAATVTLAPLSTEVGSAGSQASNTPAGTLLRVGESWTSSGLSVQLKEIEFPAANEVHLHFTFTNQSKKVIPISLDHNRNVTLTDDQGTVYKWLTAFTWEVSIGPGTSRSDEVKRRGDVSRAGYFIVRLDIPGIGSAQWRN
jgi:hypothetical protein